MPARQRRTLSSEDSGTVKITAHSSKCRRKCFLRLLHRKKKRTFPSIMVPFSVSGFFTMKSWTYFLVIFYALLRGACSMDYSGLEAMGLACPERDSCAQYDNKRTYMDRSCECDPACAEYRDCCVDAEEKSSAEGVSRSDLECLHYGDNMFSGVYAVSRCDRKWSGSEQIKEKCEGAADLSDPVSAAPVTSREQRITYKNLYCAECNHEGEESLKFFIYKLACKGLGDVPTKEIRENLSYDQSKKKWGVNRSNDQGNSSFVECQMILDVPEYLNRSVRFCRANLVSECAQNWTRTTIRKLCQEYTTAIYDRHRGYRNPFCAICNYKKISQLSCSTDFMIRRRPFSFSDIIDFNRPRAQCPRLHLYDPYTKKCRKLSCALPGYVVRDSKCVKGE